MKAIQEKLGIDKTQTMAFGDSDNDLEMLENALFGYAKTDGRPSVKEKAAFLTDCVYTQLQSIADEVEK